MFFLLSFSVEGTLDSTKFFGKNRPIETEFKNLQRENIAFHWVPKTPKQFNIKPMVKLLFL